MKKIKIWLGHKLYRWEKTGGPAHQPASPRAEPRNATRFTMSGQPGPFNTGQKRAGSKRAGLARFDTPNNYWFGFSIFWIGSIWFLSFWNVQFDLLVFGMFNLVPLFFRVVQFSTSHYIPINVVCILVSYHYAIETRVKLLIRLVCLLGVVNIILVSLLMFSWSSVFNMILRLVVWFVA